jgi:hypothetical protein
MVKSSTLSWWGTEMIERDGGPAFPTTGETDAFGENLYAFTPGMTLRDWFAGQALNGMLSHQRRYVPRSGASVNWHEAIAEEAYEIADAMLAKRETD